MTRALLAVALAVVVGAALFASSSPDGLERVAADKGFVERGEAREAPLTDYAAPGVDDPRLATALAGFAGTLIVLGGLTLVGRRR
jgi:cobalt/nickel transport protein